MAHSPAPGLYLEAVLVLVCSALARISVGTEATRAPVTRMRKEGTLESLYPLQLFWIHISGTGTIGAMVVMTTPPVVVASLS